jgi:hypothetical protein
MTKLILNVEWSLDSDDINRHNSLNIYELSWVCMDTDWNWTEAVVGDYLEEWIKSCLPKGFDIARGLSYRSVIEVEVGVVQDYLGDYDIDWSAELKNMCKLEKIPFTFEEECINITITN